MSLISQLQEQMQDVDELIAMLENDALTDRRPSVSANIRALRKEQRNLQEEFDGAALREGSAVYKYRILNSDRATVKGLAAAWNEFQDLFTAAYNSILPGGARGLRKKKGALVAASSDVPQLAWGYSFHGSVGVAMTLPRNRELGMLTVRDEAVDQATRLIFDLVKKRHNSEGIGPIAKRVGPDVVAALYRWADVHTLQRFGVGIEWQQNETTTESVVLQLEEMQLLRQELAETTFESQIEVTGELVLVDVDRGIFRLRGDGGEIYEGQTGNAITSEQAATIPARYVAKIRSITRPVQVEDKEEKPMLVLASLDPML